MIPAFDFLFPLVNMPFEVNTGDSSGFFENLLFDCLEFFISTKLQRHEHCPEEAPEERQRPNNSNLRCIVKIDIVSVINYNVRAFEVIIIAWINFFEGAPADTNERVISNHCNGTNPNSNSKPLWTVRQFKYWS